MKIQWGDLSQAKLSSPNLLLFLLLVLLLPLLGLAFHSYQTVNNEMTRAVRDDKRVVAHLFATVLKEKFDHLTSLGVSLSIRRTLVQSVKEADWAKAEEILKEILKYIPAIDRFVLVDADAISRVDVPAVQGFRGKNLADRDWFTGVSQKREPYISEIFGRIQEPYEHVVAVAVLIKDEDQKVIGVLQIQQLIDPFLSWSKKIEVGPSGFTYFVDQRGHVAGHPNFPSQGELTDFSIVPSTQKVLRGEGGVEILFNPIENEERIVGYEPVPGTGWGVIVQQPTRTAFAKRNATLRWLLIIYGATFLLACFLVFLVLRLVTQRSKAEDRFRLVLESAPNAIVMVDKGGMITLVNKQTEKLFSFLRTELIGKEVETLVPQRFRSKHPSFVQGFFQDPTLRSMGAGRDLFGLKKDGTEVPIEIGLNPLKTLEGTFVLASIIDITERKLAEESLAQEKKNLEKANLELDSFVYTASHDLRAPLRGISSFASFLEEDYHDKLDEQGRDYLEEIRKGSKRMSQLIEDLLTLSRISRIKNPYEEVNIYQLVDSVMQRVGFDLKESGVDFKVTENIPSVICDRVKMAGVFVNLINNAIKFSTKGNLRPPKVEVGYGSKDGFHQFFIKDNGIGIDPQYHSRIFELFQRLHTAKEYEGTGAGLNIVKRVVEDHGGTVWVESELGKGAVFYFTIPKDLKIKENIHGQPI